MCLMRPKAVNGFRHTHRVPLASYPRSPHKRVRAATFARQRPLVGAEGAAVGAAPEHDALRRPAAGHPASGATSPVVCFPWDLRRAAFSGSGARKQRPRRPATLAGDGLASVEGERPDMRPGPVGRSSQPRNGADLHATANSSQTNTDPAADAGVTAAAAAAAGRPSLMAVLPAHTVGEASPPAAAAATTAAATAAAAAAAAAGSAAAAATDQVAKGHRKTASGAFRQTAMQRRRSDAGGDAPSRAREGAPAATVVGRCDPDVVLAPGDVGGTRAPGATAATAEALNAAAVATPLHTTAATPTASGASRLAGVGVFGGGAAGQGSSAPRARRGAAGPAGAVAAPPPVYVFWDLDNKYPETLDHAGLLGRMRDMLYEYGKVAEIRAYGNFQTMNYVPEVWEQAMLRGVEGVAEQQQQQQQPEAMRCPVCSKTFRDEAKLRNHFKQLHAREHGKRLAHRPAAEKYVQTPKFARYQAAAAEVLGRKRGYDLEGILRRHGVAVRAVPMGKQRADVVLQREAVELLRLRQQRGAPAAPAASSSVDSGAPQPPVASPAASPTASSPVFVLVSDDHGFEALLKLFRTWGWRTLVLSNTNFKNVDARLPWWSVAAS